jgi:hypothetical protein
VLILPILPALGYTSFLYAETSRLLGRIPTKYSLEVGGILYQYPDPYKIIKIYSVPVIKITNPHGTTFKGILPKDIYCLTIYQSQI